MWYRDTVSSSPLLAHAEIHRELKLQFIFTKSFNLSMHLTFHPALSVFRCRSAASLTAVAAPAAVIGLFLALSRRRLSRWSLESCKSECRGRQENWLIFICVFVVGCCCLSFYYPSQVSGRQKTTQHWQHCHLNLISPGLDLIMTPITQFQVLEWHRGMYTNPPTVYQLVIFEELTERWQIFGQRKVQGTNIWWAYKYFQ